LGRRNFKKRKRDATSDCLEKWCRNTNLSKKTKKKKKKQIQGGEKREYDHPPQKEK